MTRPRMPFREGWERFWFTPTSTAPVEVLRIAFGLVATAWTLSLVPVLGPFFGPDAAMPRPDLPTMAWTVFGLPGGAPLVWLVWAVGLVAAVALTIGYRTRLAAVLVFVLMVSVSRQAPLAFNAGDGLLRVIAFYLVFMPAGSAASVDRWLTDPEHVWNFPRRAPWALRLAQVQLSVIYLSTVWEKSGGVLWRNGSAVSYAMRIGDVGRLPTPAFVTDSVVLSQLATFGTLAAELAIGVLVWNRAARPWVLGLGVVLHVSIEFTLAVGFFSLGMLTLYLVFLSPKWAERVLLVLRDRVLNRGRHPDEVGGTPRGTEVVATPYVVDPDMGDPAGADAGRRPSTGTAAVEEVAAR